MKFTSSIHLAARFAGLAGCLALTMTSAFADGESAEALGQMLKKKPAKIRKINAIQYFPQDGRRVTFGMDGLLWKGPGDCKSQREAMSAIMELDGKGVTVRRAYILEAPDGVHVKNSDCVIENLVFPDVCEDAITADNADRLVIRNCVFRGADDKAIQLNRGRDILIENCYFESCAKPVRVKAGVTVTVRNCVAKDSSVFVLADGDGAVATVENNRVEKSRHFVGAKKGATIRLGENQTSQIKLGNEIVSGGRIVGP
ncbi:MAG: pectate lyase [Terrimicrobiaceae bacterium]|nr:pectate lyase [Terrimicrobiaceae bacterium]